MRDAVQLEPANRTREQTKTSSHRSRLNRSMRRRMRCLRPTGNSPGDGLLMGPGLFRPPRGASTAAWYLVDPDVEVVDGCVEARCGGLHQARGRLRRAQL